MTLRTHSNVVSVASVHLWLQLSGSWWTITPTNEPGPAQCVLQLKKKGGEGGVVSFSVANSGVRLWGSYLNRKREQCQRSCRQEKIQKFSPRGGQLGAAVGSRLGVCVTRTLRTVRDNSTSVCRAESLRHLAWNQISVKAGGITERRDDLRGGRFYASASGRTKSWTRLVAFNSFRLGHFTATNTLCKRKYEVNSLLFFIFFKPAI